MQHSAPTSTLSECNKAAGCMYAGPCPSFASCDRGQLTTPEQPDHATHSQVTQNTTKKLHLLHTPSSQLLLLLRLTASAASPE